MQWDDLGFETNYSVDAEPDFPADGEWGLKVIQLDSGGSLAGGPQAIIRPSIGETWVLSTHFSNIGSIYGTPDANSLCVTDRFERATLISTSDPSRQAVLSRRPVTVAGSAQDGILLIADEQQVTAFGVDRQLWASTRLFSDDLRILRTDNGRIVCRGWNYELSTTEPVEVTLDAATGEVIA